MSRDKIDRKAASIYLRTNHAAAFGFARVQIKTMFRGFDRKTRQNRHAVLSALIAQIEREGIVHLCQLRKFGDLVNSLRSLHSTINFLQTDEIRTLRIDDPCNALQIELLVHADAHMNVVGHDANRRGLKRRRQTKISRCRASINSEEKQREK